MTSSSDQPQRIDAIEFEAPGAPAPASSSDRVGDNTFSSTPSVLATRADAPWWQSQFNLMLCVFALLALAALLFIVLTPPPNALQATSTVVAADGSASTAPSTTDTEATQTPWDESRRAQARADSQDILSGLLESKKSLEAKNVKVWAPERYQAALDKAQAGDEFYKQQDYQNAIASYQSAANEMASLNNLIPEVLKGKIEQGRLAINEGKAELAKQLFNEALALDRNSVAALVGLDRANSLDQVLSILNAALGDEQSFASSDQLQDVQAAQEKYQQALALDQRSMGGREGLSRVERLINDKRFRVFMSQGYGALFVRRYSAARSAFSQALKIKPGDASAVTAYQQSLASDKSSSLSSLLKAAQGYEKNEEWDKALSNYQVVLQRDPNQVSAKLGQIRSRARNDLDRRLNDAIADPLALAKSTQKERVAALLNDARGITSKGTKLRRQITDIETAMRQADNPLNVTFVSDALTEVSLSKAGAKTITLGKFSNRNLALKPGRYVISGTRLGFRDVRQEITLTPGTQGVQSFEVRCDQAIATAAVNK